MRKLLLLTLATLAFVACTQNDVEELTANRADVPETLTVGFEGGDDTRIQLNEAQKTVWNAGDLVSVFYKSYDNLKFEFQGETGDRIGTLKRVGNGESGNQMMDNMVVVYPYSDDYRVSLSTGAIDAYLPAVQYYTEGSYGVGSNLMVAQSEFTQFSLKSVCGWLRIDLTGEGQKVRKISLQGNNGEQLAGLINVDTNTAEAILVSSMGEYDDIENGVGGNVEFDNSIITTLTLDCGEGVELGYAAKSFYIAVPPQTFEGGVTVVVECESYEPMTLTTTEVLTIERNHIKPMESVEHDAEPATPNNEIRYTATAKVEANSSYPWSLDTFGANIVSNEWDSESSEGVITFDADVTTIGQEAFCNCDSLTSITIPDSVTTIGGEAFRDCSSLTSITIPDSVTTIGDLAFYYCPSLTSINIPDSVTTIGDYAFRYCGNLTEFNGKFASEDGRCLIVEGLLNSFAIGCGATEYTIPDSVTTIGNSAFYGCKHLTSVTIPDSVTTIGNDAFYGCRSLTSVTIPDSVTTIGQEAFYACERLTSVTIPDSVTTIGDYAFEYCKSLTSVYCEATTPPSLDGSYVFYDNVLGRTIYVPTESVDAYKSATYWSEYADYIVGYDFSTTSIINYTTSDGQIVNARLPIISNTYSNGIGTIEFWGSIIPTRALYYCDSLTSVTIPDSVTTIGDEAFAYCDSLTSITIPDSITAIGGEAFRYCSSLTSVTIPDSVTTIGDYAFYECRSLTSITIPDSVTTIGEWAFYYCDSLTSVTIGDSVTTIGNDAFYSCKSLTSVYCKATTPPSLGGAHVFDNNASGRTIYVPAESVDAYKNAEYWSEYADYIVGYDFENGVVVE